jgi:hypothetical protein
MPTNAKNMSTGYLDKNYFHQVKQGFLKNLILTPYLKIWHLLQGLNVTNETR